MHIYLSGLPLSIWANKVQIKLQNENKSLNRIIEPYLQPIINERIIYQYPYSIEPMAWHGVGANRFKKQSNNLESSYKVNTVELLLSAIKNAKAGDRIELQPGFYNLEHQPIKLGDSGQTDKAITLFAENLGDVTLFLEGEGIKVNQAFWVFKNLYLKGRCVKHSSCEHAFHVVGEGQYTTFKNNIFEGFNAAIKVNRIGQEYPDHGLIHGNTFFNPTIRQTDRSVTPIDIMQANNWKVTENFIFDFIKGGGNKISYGAFFKGGSGNGEFSKNLVMCNANIEHRDDLIGVGLSLGGGGSDESLRRKNALYEHTGGEINHNIIMHCNNGAGIYLNKSPHALVSNNVVYNTLGITTRFKESRVILCNNILSGNINAKEGANIVDHKNFVINTHWLTDQNKFNNLFSTSFSEGGNWQKIIDKISSNLSVKMSRFCEQNTNTFHK